MSAAHIGFLHARNLPKLSSELLHPLSFVCVLEVRECLERRQIELLARWGYGDGWPWPSVLSQTRVLPSLGAGAMDLRAIPTARGGNFLRISLILCILSARIGVGVRAFRQVFQSR